MREITYLASPYTHVSEVVMQERYERVRKFVYLALKRDVVYFSPIIYYHPMAREYKMEVDFSVFAQANFAFLGRMENMEVLLLPGWKQSDGIRQELKRAQLLNLSVIYVTILEETEDTQNVRYSIRP